MRGIDRQASAHDFHFNSAITLIHTPVVSASPANWCGRSSALFNFLYPATLQSRTTAAAKDTTYRHPVPEIENCEIARRSSGIAGGIAFPRNRTRVVRGQDEEEGGGGGNVADNVVAERRKSHDKSTMATPSATSTYRFHNTALD